eukprot:scaffold31546_cov66-Phaeocystis_antarctica.AAC.17
MAGGSGAVDMGDRDGQCLRTSTRWRYTRRTRPVAIWRASFRVCSRNSGIQPKQKPKQSDVPKEPEWQTASAAVCPKPAHGENEAKSHHAVTMVGPGY